MSLSLVVRGVASRENRDAADGLSVMDEEEFRAFYERTARPLWSYLSRITGKPQEADDVLQEAYYRLYRAGTKYDNESHRRNSLFQIATNIARDSARRAKIRVAVPLEDEESGYALPQTMSPMPERQAAIRTDLGRALQKLEPLQREMVLLAYGQGASHEEIAGILGVRAISIRTMLLRARKKLAALLTQEVHP